VWIINKILFKLKWFNVCEKKVIAANAGLGIKTASYPTKCKQTPPSWNEKRMFLFITLFVGNDWQPDICINTLHYFLLRSVYFICTTICKTKVIANLQLEAGQNFYENVWIRRSSYCFIYRFFRSNQLYTRFQSSP
jgi:hypothetical protein